MRITWWLISLNAQKTIVYSFVPVMGVIFVCSKKLRINKHVVLLTIATRGWWLSLIRPMFQIAFLEFDHWGQEGVFYCKQQRWSTREKCIRRETSSPLEWKIKVGLDLADNHKMAYILSRPNNCFNTILWCTFTMELLLLSTDKKGTCLFWKNTI